MSTIVDRHRVAASLKTKQIVNDSLVGVALFSGIGVLLCLVTVAFGWFDLSSVF
jgi:hypothetical protein